MILTLRQQHDHHLAYHADATAEWCLFCVPFLVRDNYLDSLQSGERPVRGAVMGGTLPQAEPWASGRNGGPR